MDEFLKNQGKTAGSYPEDTYRSEDAYRYGNGSRWDDDRYDDDRYDGNRYDRYDSYDDDEDDDDDYEDAYSRRRTPSKAQKVQKVRQTTVKTRTKTKVKRKKRRGFSLPSMPSAAGKAGRSVLGLAGLVMRVVSCILFLVIDVVLIRALWSGAGALGSIGSIISERNWALVLYLILSACLAGFGVISAVWTLSTRKAGDGRKLRSYDTGRGLLGFLIFGVIAMVSMVGTALIPVRPEIFLGLLQFVLSIIRTSDLVLRCSVIGAVLCIVRRLIGS